jgi:hypothetical protein
MVVCVGNLDSIAIARSLYASSAVRATVVQRAGDQTFCSTPADPTRCAEEAAKLLERTGIPLGWSRPNPEDGIWGWPLKVLGLLISVGAAALGAPLWYRFLDPSDRCAMPGAHRYLAPSASTRAGARDV